MVVKVSKEALDFSQAGHPPRAGHGGPAGTGFSPHALAGRLAAFQPFGPLLVAYSGGLDSAVLLHGLRHMGEPMGRLPLRAIHVHHGLLPEADAWTRHCRETCGRWGVPLEVVAVDATPAPGESPEDAARRARYGVLEVRVGTDELLLTAHHLDDQAETLLLQLLRGGGPHGLAAMPALRPCGGGRLGRPLLAFGRAELAAYAAREGLSWVEDPSNRELHLQRNFLRHEVLPVVTRMWPQAARTLGRSAGLQAGAAHILDEVAAADREAARGPADHSLVLAAIARLDPHRQRNLLRYAVRSLGLPPPGAAHLEAIRVMLAGAGRDRNPLVTWPGAQARRYDGCVWFGAPLPPRDPRSFIPWNLEGRLELQHGSLESTRQRGAGIRASAIPGRRITIGWRRGGERCRPADREHGQTLKRLFQERRVPPWLRDRLPLIYVDDQLAAVADLWVCAPFAAPPREWGHRLRWCEAGTHHPSTTRVP
ncbi:MAG: tRNA lysidine(34) synthetase TilS [Gammaproteobacteria bacterium]|nr:tRNA lysidine(34) synthetase TilS [Gammaproteobacteria bacterium]